MNDDIQKAARDAVEAEVNSEHLKLIAAVLAVQQSTQPQHQPVAPPPVQRPYGLWIAAGIGGAVALTFLAMAAALLAVAVAVGAVCATVCLLVLRSLLQDLRKGR